MRAELDAKIRKFEHRYERPSERMLQLLTWGEVKETAEILEWMQAYHVRRWLKERDDPHGWKYMGPLPNYPRGNPARSNIRFVEPG